MSTTPNIGGPVSAALEAELRQWVRRQGIVVWLDLDGHYTAFVERLAALQAAGQLPYYVQAFRGSHLDLMLALEPLTGGVDKPRLVIHLPGFTEDSVKATPLFELYAAGVRYRKKLETLVTEAAAGQVRPEQLAAFKAQPGLSLAGADTWLSGLLDADGAGLAVQLRVMTPTAVLDDLLSNGPLAARLHVPADAAAVWGQLAAWTGLPETWRQAALPTAATGADDLVFATAGWALCVEYTKDLTRPPLSPHLQGIAGLPTTVVETCRQLAAHLRDRHPACYVRTADETEALLEDEVEAGRADELSGVDTFRFEEERLLKAALGDQHWDAATRWASQRLAGGSFWLRENPARKTAWELIAAAGRLGQALAAAQPDLTSMSSLEAAVTWYVEHGAAVDRAHRVLEQQRWNLLQPQLPEFGTLRARLDQMRREWRGWADALARDFNGRCRIGGFLPPPELQQRQLFDEVVRPLTRQSGTTAYFVVDAFRFEMAEELRELLGETPATTMHLRARLAELPTVTEVGMNVLAPVATNGRLRPVLDHGRIQGFESGEFRVSDPKTRQRAMRTGAGGGTCPWLTLSEVLERDNQSLKRAVAQAQLVVVHCQEIDNAGEQGVGPAVFPRMLQQLATARHLLREAGVRQFVITADHGFLLLDESAGTAQSHGRKIDPNRRHVFSSVAADHTGEVRVPLADLGYEGLTDHVMFPLTTAVFDTGQHAMSFVHGGNSLQERVIPVLTIVHRAAPGGSMLKYLVTATAREDVGGMHCLEAKAEMTAQATLSFGGAAELELALRAPEAPGVQVELCQIRDGARLSHGGLTATVGQSFELFFRLAGATDQRVLVELYHPGVAAEVTAGRPEARFAVSPLHAPAGQAPAPAVAGGREWLNDLPEGGVRELFSHLAEHGAATEEEAARMLGGPRALRRFATKFEVLAGKAPFSVRIEVVSGVKRYVREGSSS